MVFFKQALRRKGEERQEASDSGHDRQGAIRSKNKLAILFSNLPK
jgi:hypothetical protein